VVDSWISICLFCTHSEDKRSIEKPMGPKCSAFPKGIPAKILNGEFDHRNPYPDDQGFRFEAVLNVKDLPSYLQWLSEDERAKIIEVLFKEIEHNTRSKNTDSS
jgi:hypothetical protein